MDVELDSKSVGELTRLKAVPMWEVKLPLSRPRIHVRATEREEDETRSDAPE